MKENIRLTTLPSGLKVITDTVEAVESVALGVWAGVGTRHENLKHNGVAHMVEHMLFKGTKRRDAQMIVEEIEAVGGHMNAYTSREITSYHCHLVKEHAPLALDVIADMLIHHTMPQAEVEKERSVILQEIGMATDTPDDIIFDHYYETAFPDQGLGAPILGRPDIIAGMQRESLMGYVRDFYTPQTLVVSAAGNIDHDDFVRQVDGHFKALPNVAAPSKPAPSAYKGGDIRESRPQLEQAHIVLGFEGFSRLDKNFYAAQALSAILGGGMSSRLFQEIRENRGLVYSIYSFHSGYSDAGNFGVYAGTGPESLPELIPAVCNELIRAASTITDLELFRAKAQMKASLLMARESMMTRADQQAKTMLQRGEILDMAALVEKIDALDLPAIRAAALTIFSSKPTLAALGPLEKLESYDSLARRLAA
ncbi:MAG TPA: pitrilysin family protein [Alphaproteobacteria bacterium]|nr:pitrilysin family protein [Alphaproteobacteria bacterium]